MYPTFSTVILASLKKHLGLLLQQNIQGHSKMVSSQELGGKGTVGDTVLTWDMRVPGYKSPLPHRKHT